MADIKTDSRDLYEMRLIVEPQAAYHAAMWANGKEIGPILRLGQQIGAKISGGKDRTETESDFHEAIAKAPIVDL